jgi:MFS family permease
MVLLPFAAAPWTLYAAFALMSLGWVGMGTVIIPAVIGAWFVRRRGLAISLAFLGASSGGIIVTPLLMVLVSHVGFQTAMVAASAVLLIFLLPATFAWIGPPPSVSATAARADQLLPAPGTSISRGEIVRRRAFWTIAIPFALGIIAQVGFIVHQIAILEPKIGALKAGLAVSVMTSMAIVGRVSLSVVADHLDPRLAAAISLVSQAVAVFTIHLSDNVHLVLLASAVFGFSIGNLITLPPLIIHREFEVQNFTVVMGLFTSISGTVSAFGPGLIGLIRGWRGDYGAALLLTIALEVIAAAIVLARAGNPRVVAKELDCARR